MSPFKSVLAIHAFQTFSCRQTCFKKSSTYFSNAVKDPEPHGSTKSLCNKAVGSGNVRRRNSTVWLVMTVSTHFE